MSTQKISLQVCYFGLLVRVHQLDQQYLKLSLSLVHSRKSQQTLLAKSMVFPVQAVSVLVELVTRSEGRIAPLILQAMDNSLREHMSHHPRPREEGRWEVRLYLANVNWFTNKRAELASCSQMRTNLSLCLSGTQSTPATLLFLIAHIYGACVPTIYRWRKNEEHHHKQAMIFDSGHRFCLNSDNTWQSSC